MLLLVPPMLLLPPLQVVQAALPLLLPPPLAGGVTAAADVVESFNRVSTTCCSVGTSPSCPAAEHSAARKLASSRESRPDLPMSMTV